MKNRCFFAYYKCSVSAGMD